MIPRKWQYKVQLVKVRRGADRFAEQLVEATEGGRLQEVLQEWGKSGWELVSALPAPDHGVVLIFKRPE